jgi:Phage integrase family
MPSSSVGMARGQRRTRDQSATSLHHRSRQSLPRPPHRAVSAFRRDFSRALERIFNPYGKTKAAKRRVPLNATALAILTKRVKAAKGVYLFPHHRKDITKPMLKANNAHTAALKKSGVAAFRLYDLRHTWSTRAAEAGVNVGTLASLLGHSKLVMVMRYVHPGESHRIDAVKKLAAANAARQIAEFEKKKTPQESPATISATVPENSAIFEGSKTEGKSQQIN